MIAMEIWARVLSSRGEEKRVGEWRGMEGNGWRETGLEAWMGTPTTWWPVSDAPSQNGTDQALEAAARTPRIDRRRDYFCDQGPTEGGS